MVRTGNAAAVMLLYFCPALCSSLIYQPLHHFAVRPNNICPINTSCSKRDFTTTSPRYVEPVTKRLASSRRQIRSYSSRLYQSKDESLEDVAPRVYPQRWVQLAYLSLLALLSDWICFGVAAVPSAYESLYPGHSAASLVDIFLFTNVASCFLVTDTVRNIGLEKSIKGAAILMTVGCILRSGLEPMWVFLQQLLQNFSAIMPSAVDTTAPLVHTNPSTYPFLVAGTILVGAAQPFFQCTPPLLSAVWFAADERATSTAIALNFNQIGIATAFLVGGLMAADPSGLATYFGLISVLCTALTIGTLIQFADKPPIPPSTSELEKVMKNEKEPPFIESVKRLFSTKGFTRPLAAFICSISITNVVGTFIEEVLERGGVHGQGLIDLSGAGFEIAILAGGILIGGFVDRTKQYKAVTQLNLVSALFFLIPLGLTDHWIGQEPFLVVASMLGLGMAIGPVQPINAELAVDVTYPSDETAVESVQQIGGNFVSALLVPLAEVAARSDYELFPLREKLESDIRGDVVLMMFVTLATLVYFSGFDAPLRRTIADSNDER